MALALNNNEFLATLTNLALQVITFDQITFKSPFGVFKRQYTKWGDKIACVNAFAPSGKDYGAITNPYEENKPDVYENTITTKLRKVYPLTLNNELLRGAFEDENSLGLFLNTLMAQLVTYSEIDVYEKIIADFNQMFETARATTVLDAQSNRWNGLVATGQWDKDSATEVYRLILQKAREMKLPNQSYGFQTDTYNGVQKMACAMGQDLVLILTPEASAMFDVYVNASLFNSKEIDIAKSIKTVVVADIDTSMVLPTGKGADTYVSGVFAILVTEDVYRYSPRIESMELNRNGATMGQHYHYHVWTNMGFTGSGQAIIFAEENA